VVSYASSLDTVGIIANSVQCAGLVLNTLKNNEEESLDQLGDATSCYIGQGLDSIRFNEINNVYSDCSKHPDKLLEGMRIGIPEAFSIQECSSQIIDAWERAIKQLEMNGATIHTVPEKTISSSCVKMSLPAYYVISCAEASSNLARYDGLKFGSNASPHDIISENSLNIREKGVSSTRNKGLGSEVKRRILAGTAVLSSDRFHSFYEAAASVRASITSQFAEAFYKCQEDESGVDLILIPTTLTNPPSLAQSSTIPDSTEAFQNDVMTSPISLAGLPAISVPVWNRKSYGGNADSKKYHHPVVGMQIVGPKKSEEKVLLAANVLSSENIDC
jgi:aspartyl-tRNA(Asn)/glutamyl-tRNA(Gln) amidotransferase subunit A